MAQRIRVEYLPASDYAKRFQSATDYIAYRPGEAYRRIRCDGLRYGVMLSGKFTEIGDL